MHNSIDTNTQAKSCKSLDLCSFFNFSDHFVKNLVSLCYFPVVVYKVVSSLLASSSVVVEEYNGSLSGIVSLCGLCDSCGAGGYCRCQIWTVSTTIHVFSEILELFFSGPDNLICSLCLVHPQPPLYQPAPYALFLQILVLPLVEREGGEISWWMGSQEQPGRYSQ